MRDEEDQIMTTNSMMYEMWAELKSIKELNLRHSVDRKEEIAMLSEKMDDLFQKQAEDKSEIIDRIHLVDKENSSLNGKLAAGVGIVALAVSAFGTWIMERFYKQ